MENNFLNLVSKTDVGNVRPANEDFLGHAETPNGLLYIVCDGMGGHVGGATASQMATNSIIEYFNQGPIENILVGLSDAVRYANQKIYNYAQENPELKGMGTTCTIVIAREPQIYIAHVGDSRIYLHTDGKLHRITKDHSFVQGLVDQGVIQDEEAENHPRKNEILKALGIRAEVEPTVYNTPIQPKKGDKFLLCSDGLNGEVNDLTIESLINTNTDIDKAGDELIQAALNAGGKDNITLQIIEVLNSPYETSTFPDYNPISPLVSTNPGAGKRHTTTMIETQEENNSFFSKYKIVLSVFAGLAILIGVYFIWPDGDGDSKTDASTAKEKEENKNNNNGSKVAKNDNSDYYVVNVKESEGWGVIRERLKAEIINKGNYSEDKFNLKEESEYSTKLIKWYPKGKIDDIKPYEPEIDNGKLHPGDVVRIDVEEFSYLYEEKNSESETPEERKKRKKNELKRKRDTAIEKANNLKIKLNSITDESNASFKEKTEAEIIKLNKLTINDSYRNAIKIINEELDKIEIEVDTKIKNISKQNTATASKKDNYNSLISDANNLIKDKKWKKAIEKCDAADKILPNNEDHKTIRKKATKHKNYWNLIDEAKTLLSSKEYKAAKDKYEEAGKKLKDEPMWAEGIQNVKNTAEKDKTTWKVQGKKDAWVLINKITNKKLGDLKNNDKPWKKENKAEEAKESRVNTYLVDDR